MIRRPPRSTLFPTRRSSDLAFGERQSGHRNSKYKSAEQFFAAQPHGSVMGKMAFDTSRAIDFLQRLRSEEHTSELQSRQYLVCRLLLEKKNKQHTSL